MVEFGRCTLKIQNLLCEILGIPGNETKMIPPLHSYLKNSQKHNANGKKAFVLMVVHGCVEVASSVEGSCLGKEKFPGGEF